MFLFDSCSKESKFFCEYFNVCLNFCSGKNIAYSDSYNEGRVEIWAHRTKRLHWRVESDLTLPPGGGGVLDRLVRSHQT